MAYEVAEVGLYVVRAPMAHEARDLKVVHGIDHRR